MDVRLEKALLFATKKHENQVRKDGTPYINHPIKVVELIDEYFYDHPLLNELKIAGYLHDVVEDTNTTIEEIKENFGDYVAYLVNGLTNNDYLKNKLGKTKYLSQKLVKMDDNTLNIKLCDRLANILDLSTYLSSFEDKYEIQTLRIMNYVLDNRVLTPVQMEIINNIIRHINYLRNSKVLKLNKE